MNALILRLIHITLIMLKILCYFDYLSENCRNFETHWVISIK